MRKRESKRTRRETLDAAAGEVRALQTRLECAYNIFNNTGDPELLEASILEIRALQSRYSHMLKKLKEAGAQA